MTRPVAAPDVAMSLTTRHGGIDPARVCPGESYPPPSWHLEFIDFPTGWHIARLGVLHADRRCSYVATWGGVLCDCGAIEVEWTRRKEAMPR